MMIQSKRFLVGFFIISELILFIYLGLYGKHGISVLRREAEGNRHLICKIEAQNQKIKDIEYKIALWHKEPFFKEQIARQQLHMARKDDIVYHVPW